MYGFVRQCVCLVNSWCLIANTEVTDARQLHVHALCRSMISMRVICLLECRDCMGWNGEPVEHKYKQHPHWCLWCLSYCMSVTCRAAEAPAGKLKVPSDVCDVVRCKHWCILPWWCSWLLCISSKVRKFVYGNLALNTPSVARTSSRQKWCLHASKRQQVNKNTAYTDSRHQAMVLTGSQGWSCLNCMNTLHKVQLNISAVGLVS